MAESACRDELKRGEVMSKEKVVAYCMKCQCIREVVNPQRRLLKSDRMALTGKCLSCGMTVNKLVPKPKVRLVDESMETDQPEIVEMVEEPVPTERWEGFCRLCNKVQEISKSEYVGLLWDGRKVVRGFCSGCGWWGNMLDAKSISLEGEARDGKS